MSKEKEIVEKINPFNFTFNSFRYIKDFDVSELGEMDKKPFIMLDATIQLLYGAMNCNPLKPVGYLEAEAYLAEYIKEGSIAELMEELMEALQESDFFKSLQRSQSSPTLLK